MDENWEKFKQWRKIIKKDERDKLDRLLWMIRDKNITDDYKGFNQLLHHNDDLLFKLKKFGIIFYNSYKINWLIGVLETEIFFQEIEEIIIEADNEVLSFPKEQVDELIMQLMEYSKNMLEENNIDLNKQIDELRKRLAIIEKDKKYEDLGSVISSLITLDVKGLIKNFILKNIKKIGK